MKKSLLFLLVLFVVSCKKEKKENKYYLKTTKKKIEASFNGQKFPFEIVTEDLYFPYTGKTNKIGFASAKDSVFFNLKPNDSIPLTFVLNEKDSTSVLVIGRTNAVNFSEEYIQKNRGKYKVYSTKVHELVNIAIALTKIGEKDDNLIPKNSDYYKRVIEYFKPYKNHALINTLNNHLIAVNDNATYNYYYNIKMNANMYSFERNKIVNKTPFNRMGFGEEDELKKIIHLLEDFSKDSKFSEFYNDNRDYYKSLIDTYYKLVPVDKMWKWIENKFPVKYDSYKIYFSSLVGGAHSTQKYENNGFSETLMFLNGPSLPEEYSEKEKEAILSRIVFTEIDHNYVDIITGRFPELRLLLKPINCWYSGDFMGYKKSYKTFNEYMTWSVFTLYLYDNFDKEIFKKRNKEIEKFMTSKNRGFIKYKEFNQFVLNWYKNNPNVSFEKLYPEVINWIKKQNCKK
ncbi:DUF4932 domain-containing protein [Tenacibaculum sp. nBUS_03]|uniref:DUF4932 domain-containing protein n=1 Tax=Tenacibaculum sp. nBUS_03 TaxID=3395320 RepID=UPI003EB8CCB4